MVSTRAAHGPGRDPGLVLLAVCSLQAGAVIATPLAREIGPAGVVTLRLGLAALILGLLTRPTRRSVDGRLPTVLAVGVVLCVHHLAYYSAISRIPLGSATTIEFAGPFAVAVATSRRRWDVVWAVTALVGVVLVAGPTAARSGVGVLAAVGAGAAWATYIWLARRLALLGAGGDTLAVAVAVGAVVSLPLGVGAISARGALVAGTAVAVLSTLLPYLLQLHALRRLPARLFSLLTSTEPAVAALFGLAFLGQTLDPRAWFGVAAVVLTSVAVTLEHGRAIEHATPP
jgi:inner membrane transporter RhtA